MANSDAIHYNPVWKKLCQVARESGLRVYVKPLDGSDYQYGEGTIILNENIPNYLKSQTLAMRIAFWNTAVLTPIETLSPENIKILWHTARREGEKLHSKIKRAVYPSNLDTMEGHNRIAQASRKKLELTIPIRMVV